MELHAGKRGNPIKDADIDEFALQFQNTFWQSTHLSRRDKKHFDYLAVFKAQFLHSFLSNMASKS